MFPIELKKKKKKNIKHIKYCLFGFKISLYSTNSGELQSVSKRSYVYH